MRDIFGILYRDEKGTTFDEMNLSVFPRKSFFSSTVSKKKLHDYLKLMFVRFLCPPRSPHMPFRIDEPWTFAYFFTFLIYFVQNAGCPAHWVGEILQSIVDDKLVTDVIPHTGNLPIQLAAKNVRMGSARKVNLKPWRAELETVLVSIKPILPFSITLPDDLASMTPTIRPSALKFLQIRDTRRASQPFKTVGYKAIGRYLDACFPDLMSMTLHPSSDACLVDHWAHVEHLRVMYQENRRLAHALERARM